MTTKSQTADGSYDVIIAGGGPAGLASALSFAYEGWSVCVVERAPERVLADPSFDGREIALTHHTIQWLKDYGAWEFIDSHAVSPLETARIESGTDNGPPLLFQPPEEAQEAGEALGYLVANHLIRRALYQAVAQTVGITLCCDHSVTSYRATRRDVTVRLDDGQMLTGRLLVGADGRFSRVRDMAGIGAIVHDFGRDILVCRMRHLPSHEQTALQWFDENQTIALLPVAPDGGIGDVSSLVLTLPPDDIARLRAAPDDVFNTEITERTRERLGMLRIVSERITYPLKAVYAHRFQAQRLALIGDAAVGMHPITAHGFNLGLKGQETLVREIQAGTGDPGDSRALFRFAQRHRRDTFPLFAATNAIAVAYTRDEKPFLMARRAGLALAERLSPFKKAVTRMLMDPTR
ncbi:MULTISPECIES: 5-demethoxyubiquinol-8 5-hydroxylase UbiM [unclassified Saccharibacter]|uniref:5-demethoxyubiquinol-8 5-hydroxylase UbiM n=1 Tax=unclassified Saccharibacter TaxID=2648722 RepID=UPI00132063ED|nr:MULTISPECIES: 5-demethoxyubiquinol-8 5-hydroxylase UbiM [unclassified Saccharibacter]MXV35168.1 5-demethoxyubiquinol-8 5-hydroxylase UbiM [Saccharibacter sp. EH611]MXV57285.1 5-demethoxyubiquinol-8 5-hydroxylase UbiM [Saccharibacter sp. EH70]MXV64854.1 5-demethoxyubiquinol-8 5-hydroxylase UbiM [Saccharibacter sp. EH60]